MRLDNPQEALEAIVEAYEAKVLELNAHPVVVRAAVVSIVGSLFAGLAGKIDHKQFLQDCIENSRLPGYYDRQNDIEDFHNFCREFGLDEAGVRRISENTLDQIALPPCEAPAFEVLPSQIEGLGVFAKVALPAELYIGKARIDGKRTPLGRYTNHAKKPNAEMIMIGDDVWLFLKAHVRRGEEITIDYRQVGRDIQGLTPCPM